jgi:hypothetical protein
MLTAGDKLIALVRNAKSAHAHTPKQKEHAARVWGEISNDAHTFHALYNSKSGFLNLLLQIEL